MISASFHLRRNTGYYTLQVFVPCGLIVCSSWVSFWIDPDAVPARVSLAVTTVLSMTTMGFGGRASMPRVNYPTALDWFVIMCFAFVFAVMLEYAAINFIDKVTVDLRRLLEERKKKKNSTASAAAAVSPVASASRPPRPHLADLASAPAAGGHRQLGRRRCQHTPPRLQVALQIRGPRSAVGGRAGPLPRGHRRQTEVHACAGAPVHARAGSPVRRGCRRRLRGGRPGSRTRRGHTDSRRGLSGKTVLELGNARGLADTERVHAG
ncbi:hypothetical protein ONE63_009432 [Megalurothrips usitatus]|uniref:Neurotransmitter-gated ion-channel transmembrane domain-containing protein n=1 Tax=Megalurothrips usitatus TaxID=439358 RepID=A0AAV7XM58_9NEOP|nr:hypothetical protein ONE63_009432 [Megalurothrips usitatus]